jgi:hypothetical protein
MLFNLFIESLFVLAIDARSGSAHNHRAKRQANLNVDNLSRNI